MTVNLHNGLSIASAVMSACLSTHVRHAVILFSLVSATHAADYYVDASAGSDTSPGTITQPWRSLAKVSAFAFRPGDNIYLKRGELWRETLIVSAAGTRDRPITIGAYTDPMSPSKDNPIVSCARDVTDKLWQGILPNGGFEDTEVAVFDLNDSCNGAAYNKIHKHDAGMRAFPGWTAKGSGRFGVTQKINDDSGEMGGPGRVSAQIDSSGAFASITSDAFSLRPERGTSNKPRYRLQGYLKSGPGLRVAIELYSAGTVKKYLSSNAEWEPWSNSIARKPLKVVTSTGWEYFEIEFDGISEHEEAGLAYLDSENTRITVSVSGKAPARGWVGGIKLIDTSKDYWSAKTVYNHNPKIFLIDGERAEQGSREWDDDKSWHTGAQHTVRYLPETGERLGNKILEIGQRRTGIKLDGAQYIVLENISITGCEKSLGNSTCDGAGLLLTSGASYNLVRNITTSNSEQGIRVEGKGAGGPNRHNQFIDIHSHTNRSGGIALRNHSENNIIKNCTVNDIGMFETDSEGQDIEPISLGGDTGIGPGNLIEGCTVYNARTIGVRPAQGIVAFNAPYTIIRNNLVHDTGQSGIVLAANSSHSKIIGNTIFNTGMSEESAYGAGISILADIGAMNDIEVSNNTIAKCINRKNIYGGITLRGSPGCIGGDCAVSGAMKHTISNAQVIKNNIYGCSGDYPFSYYVSHIDFDTLTSDYNAFYHDRSNKRANLILFEGSEYSSKVAGKYSVWHNLNDFQRDKRNKKNMFDMHSIQSDLDWGYHPDP